MNPIISNSAGAQTGQTLNARTWTALIPTKPAGKTLAGLLVLVTLAAPCSRADYALSYQVYGSTGHEPLSYFSDTQPILHPAMDFGMTMPTVSYSPPVGATYRADAQAFANYGTLKASASVVGAGGSTAGAYASWSTLLLPGSALPGLPGTHGTVRVDLNLTGLAIPTEPPAWGTAAEMDAQYSLQLSLGTGTNALILVNKHGLWVSKNGGGGPATFTGDAIPGMFSVDVPVTFGSAATLSATLFVAAGFSGDTGVPGTPPGQATVDFSHTLSWLGVEAAWDHNGNPVTDFTWLSESGMDWVQPASEFPADTCVETNGVKYVQWPDLYGGVDVWDCSVKPPQVTDSPWWLADDFVCTNTGPITDIHLWGSWQNDAPLLNSITFQLYVLNDVPTNANNYHSHPGTNVLWHQTFVPGSYAENHWSSNAVEYFLDPGPPQILGGDSVVWYYCFYPTNLTQYGTPGLPQTYWLVAFAELPAGTTNVFGWKTTTNVQHDISVHLPWTGFGSAPLDSYAWIPTSEYPNGQQPLDLAFKLTTPTNQCTTPPQLLCSNLVVNCTNSSWLPPVPGVYDPCCPSPDTPYLAGSFIISNCPTVYEYDWSYTNCQGQTASCTSFVTITSAPPVLVPSNITIECGSPIPTNPPAVLDPCCPNIVPELVFSYSAGNPCSNTIYQIWKAVDCLCTNNVAYVTQTVAVVDFTPPVFTNCPSSFTVECGSSWEFGPAPGVYEACCPSNITFTTQTNLGTCSSTYTGIWTATDCCGNSATCTQVVTVSASVPCVAGETWTPHESNRAWESVASSADGSKLVALTWGGQIYTSTDSGVTWTPRDSNRPWASVASSADGSKLVAAADGGQIYTSTDSGVTWTPRESNRGWWSVASSADGSKLVALEIGGQIYTSTDSGVTWTPRESYRYWQSVASSADGSRLVAVVNTGQIYTSMDSGVAWTPRESNRYWASVSSSADGSKLVAVVNDGQIYTSTDSGVTWTPRESNRGWWSVVSSADGSKLVAVVNDGQIYTSTDSGVTWTPRESNRIWLSVASSADGSKLVAVVNGGQIYTSICTGTGLLVDCPTNKTVECDTPWNFDEPTPAGGCCTNLTITILNTKTNSSPCALVITRDWAVTDCCGNSTPCSQTVTVEDTTPPVFTNCPADKAVACDSNWDFDTPGATDTCCLSNVSVNVESTLTNLGPPLEITRTWRAVDCCNNTSAPCSQAVTVTNCPTSCLDPHCWTNITVTLPCGSNCVNVYYSPWAQNLCNPNDFLTFTDPPSGSCFTFGDHTVDFWAVTSTETNHCSFIVSVLPDPNCPPVAPTLTISRLSKCVVQICWTDPGTNYVLQSATNLTLPVHWQDVEKPAMPNGGQWCLLCTNACDGTMFFRLVLGRLPMLSVVAPAVTPTQFAALSAQLNLPASAYDTNGAVLFTDPNNFMHLPTEVLGDPGTQDEEGVPLVAERLLFDQINQIQVVSDPVALQSAAQLLGTASLMPTGIVVALPEVVHAQFTAVTSNGAPICDLPIDTKVRYECSARGLPIIGPGSKVSITFGENGGVTHINYSLRQLIAGPTLPLPPPNLAYDAALNAYQSSIGQQQGEFALTSQLVYYAPPSEFASVQTLFPHYEFSGTFTPSGGSNVVQLRSILIPAISDSNSVPRVQLSVGAQGNSISAQAVVVGGLAPYHYRWGSCTTPFAAPDSSSISYQATSRNGVETLVLLVTDANGLGGTANTNIALTGSAAALGITSGPSPLDASTIDVGTEWIGTTAGLRRAPANAAGFVGRFGAGDGIVRFNWGEGNAFERDFKDPLFGGDDNNWVDNVDAVFYTGHANGDGWVFTSSVDDTFLHYSEARYGQNDLEWLVIAACGPLQLGPSYNAWWQRWGPAFQGLHLLCGYDNSSSDTTLEGRKWADYMLRDVPVADAWTRTGIEVQSGRSLRVGVMGVLGTGGLSNRGDHFWGHGSVGPDIRAVAGYWITLTPVD